jgi:hypothetical protein
MPLQPNELMEEIKRSHASAGRNVLIGNKEIAERICGSSSCKNLVDNKQSSLKMKPSLIYHHQLRALVKDRKSIFVQKDRKQIWKTLLLSTMQVY